MHEIVDFILNMTKDMGYLGIFFLMFLESSFFPFPSEVVMVPAGYLASKGEMNLFFAIMSGVLGSLFGAWFNYLIAAHLGRKFLLKFLSESKVKKLEGFFEKHGAFSTFSGRLLPGVRQYISFPAGLAKMNGFVFSLFTALGAFIWVSILAGLGYFIGENEELIKRYLHIITAAVIVFIAVFTYVYIKIKRRD